MSWIRHHSLLPPPSCHARCPVANQSRNALIGTLQRHVLLLRDTNFSNNTVEPWNEQARDGASPFW